MFIIGLKDYINVQSNVFPPNILQWAGASILGNIKRTEKMSVSKQDYVKNENNINDKYWELLNATHTKVAELTGPRTMPLRRSSSLATRKIISTTITNP